MLLCRWSLVLPALLAGVGLGACLAATDGSGGGGQIGDRCSPAAPCDWTLECIKGACLPPGSETGEGLGDELSTDGGADEGGTGTGGEGDTTTSTSTTGDTTTTSTTGDGDTTTTTDSGDGDTTTTTTTTTGGDGDGDTTTTTTTTTTTGADPYPNCGWNPYQDWYACGWQGVNPREPQSIFCPDVDLVENDWCPQDFPGYQGCCDQDGDNWYCSGANLLVHDPC